MRETLPLTALALVFLGTVPARAQDGLPPTLREVRFDQRLNAQVPLDLAFRDETGAAVHLRDYCAGKPVILVLAYYKCPMLCTEVLNGLVRGLLDVPFNVGDEFRVVTVSFDPREQPDLAAAKKKTYLERYRRAGAEQGWHFLTGAEPEIRQLTEAVGFHYVYDAKHDQYAHRAGILILTPEGRISRYFYGIRFSPRDLRLGLVEASANRIGSPVEQVLLFCFHYDPAEGKYGVAVMNFVRLGGVATLLALGTLLVVLKRQEWRRARLDAKTPVAQS